MEETMEATEMTMMMIVTLFGKMTALMTHVVVTLGMMMGMTK